MTTKQQKVHLKAHFGGYSSKGQKMQNQDAFAVYVPNNDELLLKGCVAAIADGVSSANKAAEAAQLAVTQFIQEYYSTSETWSTHKSAAKVLTSLNQWLYSQSETIGSNAQTQQWLTTFSAMIIKSTTGYIFHVGDCRISKYRQQEFETITRDHNRKQGNAHVILTRALGADPRLKVDFHQLDIKQSDIYMLSCDGFHDYLSPALIKKQLAKLPLEPSNNELEQVSQQLTEQAIALGSRDNVSCLLIYIKNIPNRRLEEISRDLLAKAIPPALKLGMTLDSYRVVKLIHASSRSHLYLVEKEGNKSPFVLKIPSQNFADDALYIQGFMREAWVGERIHHENIMKVIPENKDSKFIYHVCEHIEGQTLSEWMHDNPKPSIGVVRDIIGQIISALRVFQRLELVHRDLKPDNIMINQFGQIKLIDYGTVFIPSLAENTENITETVPQGSLNYIAPETLLTLEATNLSDLFSLGVICYELLSGELPYQPMTRAFVTQTHFEQWQYRSIKQFRPELPYWLDISLQQSTQADPRDRYQGFSEFAADLNKPNLQAIEEFKKLPLLKRNPIKFWQGLSIILFILLLTSLAN